MKTNLKRAIRGAVAALLGFLLIGCAKTTFYDPKTGNRLVKTSGDITDLKMKGPGFEISVAKIDHSTATRAQGTAAKTAIQAAGNAIAATGVVTLLK